MLLRTYQTADRLACNGVDAGTRVPLLQPPGPVRGKRPRRFLAAMLLLLGVAGSAMLQAQNADFNVTVNTGAVPPNNATVYPGEATSLRVTLANNSTVNPLTGVNFNKALPGTAVHSLLINGASSIGGDPGCTGGTLTTTPGLPGVVLSGLTIPVRQNGVPGSGECYIELPIVATSTNGAATSLSYALNAGEVGSDQGTNATGGPQSITIRAAQRPTWSQGCAAQRYSGDRRRHAHPADRGE